MGGSIQGEAYCFCCTLIIETGCEIPFTCSSLSARLCSASVTLALVCELLVSALQVQTILFVRRRHHHLLTWHLFTFAVNLSVLFTFHYTYKFITLCFTVNCIQAFDGDES